MSAPALVTSDFGLHRGRRALAGLLAAVALGWGSLVVWRDSRPVLPPAPPPAVEPSAAIAPPAPRAKAKTAHRAPSRRSKAVQRAPAPVPASTPAPASVPDDAPVFAAFPSETAGSPPPMPAPEPEAAPALDEVDSGNGEAIARAIAANQRAAVRDCFERELKADPKLQGTVAVELDLLPPNRVGAVRVSDDLERPAFTECVATTMRQAKFGALNEEVSVRVPYVLSAQGK